MSRTALSLNEVIDMMKHVAGGMQDSQDILTEADRMGDADHGEGMARGFAEVANVLEKDPGSSVGEIMTSTGRALMMKVGGAAGAVFGTLFRGGGVGLLEKSELDAEALSVFLRDGLEAVKKRGNANVGQKTMVDALEPAAEAAAEAEGGDIVAALEAAAEAAEAGKEKTKEMVATTGKAKTLGERTIGHPDPGAVSVSLILGFMRDFAKQ